MVEENSPTDEIEPLKILLPDHLYYTVLEDVFSFQSFLLDEGSKLPKSFRMRLRGIEDETALRVYLNEKDWRSGARSLKTTDSSLMLKSSGTIENPIIVTIRTGAHSGGTFGKYLAPGSSPKAYTNSQVFTGSPFLPIKLMAIVDNGGDEYHASLLNLQQQASSSSTLPDATPKPLSSSALLQRDINAPFIAPRRNTSLIYSNVQSQHIVPNQLHLTLSESPRSTSAPLLPSTSEPHDLPVNTTDTPKIARPDLTQSIANSARNVNSHELFLPNPASSVPAKEEENENKLGIFVKNWKCREAADEHDIFISYRVASEENLAQLLKLKLEHYAIKNLKKNVHVYLDKNCLVDGRDFEEGFLNGIMRSRVILLLCSERCLDKVKRAHEVSDNMLLEWEYALKLMDEGQSLVLPVLIGTKKTVESDGTKFEAMVKFSQFDVNVYKDAPQCHPDHPLKTMTVKNIMTRIFRLQGIPNVFQDMIDDVAPKILESLSRVQKSQSSVKKVMLTQREVDDLRIALQPLEKVMESERNRFRALHHEGTREWLWELVENWLNSSHRIDHKRILWLQGTAGLGKSVIASMVSDRLQAQNRLVTSFYCKYDDSRRNDPHVLIRTLAFGLALWNADFGRVLLQSTKLSVNFNAADELFKAIILEPMVSLKWISSVMENKTQPADAQNETQAAGETGKLKQQQKLRRFAEGQNATEIKHPIPENQAENQPKGIQRLKKGAESQKDDQKIDDTRKEKSDDENAKDSEMYEMRAVIVVDALDECGVFGQRSDVLKIFSHLCMRLPKWINIFVTGRPEEDIVASFDGNKVPRETIEKTDKQNLEDLRIFFRKKLESKVMENELTKIVDLMVERSKGAFIWAAQALLQLEEIFPITVENVEKLPTGLTGVHQYSLQKIYAGIPVDLRQTFKSILSMIAAAFQPLTTADISELTGLNKRQVEDAKSRLASVINISNSGHISFVHKSVSDYLLDRNICDSKLFVDQRNQRVLMAPLCLKSINRMSIKSVSEPNFQYTAVFWAEHLEEVTKEGEIMSKCVRELHRFVSEQLVVYHLALVELCQLDDFIPSSKSIGKWINMVRSLTDEFHSLFPANWTPYELLEKLIEKRVELFTDKMGRNLLYCFAANDEWRCVELLLESSLKLNVKQTTNDGNTVLHLAASAGKLHAINILIAKGAEINKRNKEGESALFRSVNSLQLSCVETLVDSGADVKFITNDGESAISKACVRGDIQIVQFLLRSGANTDVTNKDGESVLYQTLQHEKWACAEVLILAGANVATVTKTGNTALHSVAISGNIDIFTLLLSKKADLNVQNDAGETPVYLAARNSHQKMFH
ncbi:hypothetical protein HK096_004108, partial [Nowakowskiella sp. JEL0078]